MNLLPDSGLQPQEVAALIPHRPILVGYRGSHAHGMYVPPTDPSSIDDIDIMSVFILDLERYFGAHGEEPPKGRDVKIHNWDAVSYEVRKMVSLLCKGNPNVLSLLWIDTPHIIHIEREGHMLREARKLFATKRVGASFGAYAYAQLKRMTAITQAPQTPSACGCTGKFHAPECSENQQAGRGSSKRFATGFMGEKRKALAEKFGYDCKNAAHLLRLLRMGREFLETGDLIVDRRIAGDAEMLLKVKRGEEPLSEVQAEAEYLFGALRAAQEASTLPDSPNMMAVNRLLMDILCLAHGNAVTLRCHEVTRERFKRELAEGQP